MFALKQWFCRKIFEALLMLVFGPPPPPIDNIFGKHFYYLVKILGKVGQYMTTPPPPPHPPNVDVFTMSLEVTLIYTFYT